MSVTKKSQRKAKETHRKYNTIDNKELCSNGIGQQNEGDVDGNENGVCYASAINRVFLHLVHGLSR